MGILSSSLSLARYRVVEEVPDDLLGRIPDLLLEHRFQEIDETNDERGFGWVCFDDLLDTEWKTAIPGKGSYLTFALRLDTRRIQPAVMKKYYRCALEEAYQEQKAKGHKFLSRDYKKEIHERVRQYLLGKTLPVPAVFDVVWDLNRHVIYFCSINAKVRELFEDHFTRSFELHLEPQTPYFLARHLLDAPEREQLDNLEASILT